MRYKSTSLRKNKGSDKKMGRKPKFGAPAELVTKSWFCVFANPEEHGYEGEPHEIVEKIISEWIGDSKTRSCAVTYCISADGLRHLHAVFEDSKAMRFTVIKEVFPSMHIEPTKGTKSQAEDYINKRGIFEESGEQVIYIGKHGDIQGAQGRRSDLEHIDELLDQGYTPRQIMLMDIQYRRYEAIIRKAYYDKRFEKTPMKREVKVIWHIGASGSGKTYEFLKLAEELGSDQVYIMTDYENGGFDAYNGEPVLFIDEFRGQIKYSTLLSTILQGYRVQIHCRYSNVYALWSEVHITSVLPPELLYHNMVSEHKHYDTLDQLRRRITTIVYHYKEKGDYKQIAIPMSEYEDFETLKKMVDRSNDFSGFSEVSQVELEQYELPF